MSVLVCSNLGRAIAVKQARSHIGLDGITLVPSTPLPTTLPTAVTTTFDGVATALKSAPQLYQRFSYTMMGDWFLTGNAFIADKNSQVIQFGSTIPNGLQSHCMLEAISVEQPSSIQYNFGDLIMGHRYAVSFYVALRKNDDGVVSGGQVDKSVSQIPQSFSVTVGGTINSPGNIIQGGFTLYSAIPTSTNWVLVTTNSFTAVSPYLNLNFQITAVK